MSAPLTRNELTVVLWQNLPDYARIALEHDGVSWADWKHAGEYERWQMLKRALND